MRVERALQDLVAMDRTASRTRDFRAPFLANSIATLHNAMSLAITSPRSALQ